MWERIAYLLPQEDIIEMWKIKPKSMNLSLNRRIQEIMLVRKPFSGKMHRPEEIDDFKDQFLSKKFCILTQLPTKRCLDREEYRYYQERYMSERRDF